ncbi:MAG TPA: hypothetical protein VM512_08540, partial [Burkholderiaceae bacterium]|nr:hypothetical protein [Burkholderiaceae bacterium]
MQLHFRLSGARLARPWLAMLLAASAWSVQAATAQDGRNFDAERSTLDAARQWTEYRFKEAEHACYERFFVNACLNKADDVRREALQDIRRREIAVNDAERAQKAAIRDREAAIRKAQYEAEQGQRDAEARRNRAAFEDK